MGAHERLNAAPVANAGGPYTIDEGTPLALVGSSSTDEEGPIASYAWDCTNNGSNEVTSSSATGSTCTYSDDGQATLKLTVTDLWGVTDAVTTEVTVLNVSPTFTAALDQSTFGATIKSFKLGNFADPGADAPWQVTVEWGDGTPNSEFTTATPGALTASHTYASEGFFNVNVTVSDDAGSSSDGFVARVNAATVGIVVGKIVVGDEGIGGVEVKLTDELVAAGAELERTALTDTDGSYDFDNIAPGDYILTFMLPDGYALVGQSQHSINVTAGRMTTAPNFTLRPVIDGEDGQVFIPMIQKR
jgi:PKD repeat protein